jgi:cytoskeletal protein CcmA (bactofilin family)
MSLAIIKLFRQKVKGGALQYTIVFSLLILMSLSLFLMFVRLNSLEVYSAQKETQLIDNINSAIVILENEPHLFENQAHNIQLLEDSTYTTHIEFSEWGFYDKVKIVSGKGLKQLSKMYFFTDNLKKNERIPSLYLSGPKQYLSIGGKAYLGNNTYLPGNGIRKSYINGIGYDRDSLVQGNSFKAAKSLPKPNKKWAERYRNLRARISGSSDRSSLTELKKDSISVSFNDETLVLRCPNNYNLKDKYLGGNIIVSGEKLRIANTSHIHQCILIADTIVLEKHFKGDTQLFAEDYIEIGDSSVLEVPSVLYLNNKNKSDQIEIKSGTRFQGEIMIPNQNKDRDEILVIEEGFKMAGQIFCNGYASFEGVLFGSFYTTGFMNRSRSGLYENYLVDVCIDSNRLPDEYYGISIIEKSKGKICAEEIH